MASGYDSLKEYDERIKTIEKAARELAELGSKNEIPSVKSNSERILASVKILKMNISDVLDSGV
jgi:hypothetical protein